MGRCDYRSDIYAIGAVCYELLSYQKAFEGDTTFAVIGKIVLEKPPPLADVCPEPRSRHRRDRQQGARKGAGAALPGSRRDAGRHQTRGRRRAHRRGDPRPRRRCVCARRAAVVEMDGRGGGDRGGRDRTSAGARAAGCAPRPLRGAFGRLLDQDATVGCRARLQEPLGACRCRLAVHGARGNVDDRAERG